MQKVAPTDHWSELVELSSFDELCSPRNGKNLNIVFVLKLSILIFTIESPFATSFLHVISEETRLPLSSGVYHRCRAAPRSGIDFVLSEKLGETRSLRNAESHPTADTHVIFNNGTTRSNNEWQKKIPALKSRRVRRAITSRHGWTFRSSLQSASTRLARSANDGLASSSEMTAGRLSDVVSVIYDEIVRVVKG